jgi:integrase
LVVVGACNATNLMDGLDGLCGGVTAIIFAGFLFVCVHLATTSPGQGLGGDGARMAMALALLGAVLGFVPFNFNPASIFMGDTGSMFLGFSCGTLMLLLAEVQSKWFLASMVIFALPILDTALAFARRWIAGRPLFSADSKHFHHQLMQRGLSTRQTVAIAYALTLVFTALGLVITFTRTRFAIAIYLVIFACLGVAAHKMGMIHERKRRSLNSNKATRAQTLSSEDFAKIIAQAPDPEFGELLRIAWETGCRSRQARTVSANDVDLTNRAWVLSSPDLNDPHRVKIITLNDVALEITQRRMREFPIGPLFRDPRGLPWTPASCSARFRAMGRILQRRYTFKAIQIGRKMATAGAGNPRSTSAPVWIEAGVSGGSLKEDVDDSGFGVRGIGALDASA